MTRPRPESLRPDPAFERLASREPLYAVFPKPAHRASALTDDLRAAFYASGDALVGALGRTIELSLAPHFEPTRILEYGCGPGRLALPLARLAARVDGTVTAVDRSPAMLEALARESAARGVINLRGVAASDFWAGDDRFDCIVCYLVLQRIPQTEATELVGALLGRLLPGGIIVVQFPYQSRASAAAEMTRWVRARVPGANAAVNLARGVPSGDPFFATECHSFETILQVFRNKGFAGAHVTFDDHGDLDSAIVLGESPMLSTDATARASIDVATVIRDTPPAALNRSAEEYYASLTTWDHHLAKPLASADEAPRLLSNTATLLQGLDLAPGLTVLEYGAGTGWLSRMITQLGCRAILLDVSPTAHAIARELYRRQPPIGAQPAPEFLAFDGARIDLPDESVDRIVCFHAFHHAPNPEAVIGEFARVLRPGGRAVFAEPGPRHSQTPQSQFEMQNYQVVENDVRVHDLWRAAQAAGFSELTMMASNGLPFHVSLADYDDLLRGGPTADAWTAATRVFLRNVRDFILIKGGAARPDSRSVAGLSCHLRAVAAATREADGALIVHVTVTNTGTARWLQAPGTHGHVSLGLRTFDASGALASTDVLPHPLAEPARAIEPGETVRIEVRVPPATFEGRTAVEFDCVAEGVTWFAQVGGRTARMDLTTLV